MRSRFLVAALGFLVVSVVLAETALAFSDDEMMLMKVSQSCRLGSGQTSVPTGQATLDPLAVISKNPGEILAAGAVPPSLVQVPYSISSPKMMAVYVPGKDFEQMTPAALQALSAMLGEANATLTQGLYTEGEIENAKLYVHSGYRAYDVQCRLFNKKIKREMELYPGYVRTELEAIASVNSRSALPGQSEHQLGTAVDLVSMIPGLGFELETAMDQTGFAWLQANAFRYGYALSYPKGGGDVRLPNPRTGYVYEPWHWRFVGVAHATAFQMCARSGVTLQEYLRSIKANPYTTCR
jgi:LAS superfamily LD-carboxypeptidase LdcB